MQTTKEQRELKMHKKLLFDTIKRQCGTLEKANLEGIMNSIEAGASKVSIYLDAEKDGEKATLLIEDDGEGICTKEELQHHFETFGTPHDESENTYWKQFRMGRGQMFAFGKNVWRTSTFRMTVDIDNWGLKWELEENLPEYDGCSIEIELYKNPIGSYLYYSLDNYKEALQKQIAFVNTPIFFNDEQINKCSENCNWDCEDEYAYYLFNKGVNFRIYNLGVFVQEIPASTVGMDGIAVSKQKLKVNFARNDVLNDCPVYNHINEIIKKNRIKKTTNRKRKLLSFEKISVLRDLRDGVQNLEDIKDIKIITTTQGKSLSLFDV